MKDGGREGGSRNSCFFEGNVLEAGGQEEAPVVFCPGAEGEGEGEWVC